MTLYGEEGYKVISDLPVQLQELIRGRGFPFLSSIVLEELEAVCHRNGNLKSPYQDLKQACRVKGISFQVKKDDQLRKGGRFLELWTKTLYMEDNGRERDPAVANFPRRIRDRQELVLHSSDDSTK